MTHGDDEDDEVEDGDHEVEKKEEVDRDGDRVG